MVRLFDIPKNSFLTSLNN